MYHHFPHRRPHSSHSIRLSGVSALYHQILLPVSYYKQFSARLRSGYAHIDGRLHRPMCDAALHRTQQLEASGKTSGVPVNFQLFKVVVALATDKSRIYDYDGDAFHSYNKIMHKHGT